MMRKVLVFLALLAIMGHAAGKNRCYNPPLVMGEGWHLVDMLPCAVASADAHARFRLGKGQEKWRLAWNWRDSLNYIAAIVCAQGRGVDEIYGRQATVAIVSVSDGVESEVCSRQVSCGNGQLSVKLVYDGFSARVYAGDGEQALVGSAPFDSACPGSVMVLCEQPMLCVRLMAEGDPLPPPAFARYDSAQELIAAVADSDDPFEGVWEYLDRDVYDESLSIGGRYRLAIVRDGENYSIVYLGGAEINPQGWQPLQIKGWLVPTIFEGNCDLAWIDANGRLLDKENNAQLGDENAVLELRFPLYRGQIRLKRVIVK